MKLFLVTAFLVLCHVVNAQDIVNVYDVPSSRQAVAVDSAHFFVINNRSITKHRKSDGAWVGGWADRDSMIQHLNSGIIIDGKLYCIHSNYPGIPMVSSLEIFDPKTLEHLDSHSFGILHGSATWIDRYGDFWYVSFAHYTGKGGVPDRSNAWSRLVKFDTEWRQIESWVFPDELLERFNAKSCSGGVILPDGRILCTGHDNFEAYVLEFPSMGSTLRWVDTIPVGSYGQGIGYDQVDGSAYIYGIIKAENKVVVTKIQ